MMMSGPSLGRSQKLALQHYSLEVLNIFTKAKKIHTCFGMIASNVDEFVKFYESYQSTYKVIV